LLTFIIVVSGGAAVAGDDAEALIRKGLDFRKRGDDLGALPLFEQAHKMAPTARAAAQRGFCEQALGRWADAEVHLSEALKAGGDPWIRKNRTAIEESLAAVKAKVAVIEVTGEPAGSEVLVNGLVVGQVPLAGPLRVGAGEVDVELRAPGYRPATRRLHVEGGQYQRIVLRADREVSPVAPVSAPVATSPAAPAATSAPVPVTEPGPPPAAAGPPAAAVSTVPAAPMFEPQSPSSGRAALKWVSFGLGAVALGAGIYGAGHRSSLLGDFNTDCAIDPATGPYHVPGSTRTDDSCRSLKSDYESAGTLAVVGFVGAGVLVATGVVLWLTEPQPRRAETAFACAPDLVLGPAIGPGSRNRASLTCSLRF
jgi:hypothetical protein